MRRSVGANLAPTDNSAREPSVRSLRELSAAQRPGRYTERVIVVDDGVNEVRAGVFVAQALNHANHHREQVCAMLTALGVGAPDIQAWEYAWATGRLWERAPEVKGP